MSAPRVPATLALASLAVLGVGLFVWSKGGVKGAAAAVVSAVGDAAAGAASVPVNAVSETVGIPTTDETTTDPLVARWLIDGASYWEASFWSGLPALLAATRLPVGSGHPPPANSAIAKAFPWLMNPASYDETDRLLRRYPAPPADTVNDDMPSFNWNF